MNRRDPSLVAAAFVATLLSVDTRIDSSPTVAAARAGVYATPALAAVLAQRPAGSSGADWAALVARSGFTVCDTSEAGLGDRPADTSSSAVRAVAASVTGFTSGADTLFVRPHVVVVSLASTGAGMWEVSAWQYAD